MEKNELQNRWVVYGEVDGSLTMFVSAEWEETDEEYGVLPFILEIIKQYGPIPIVVAREIQEEDIEQMDVNNIQHTHSLGEGGLN